MRVRTGLSERSYTIPDTPCIANYDNSLENSSHTNPHFLTGVHPA